MKKKAILMALSDKLKDNALIIVDEFNLEPKTKKMNEALTNLKISGSVLLAAAKKSANLKRASANLKKIGLIQADSLNLEEVLKSKYLVLDLASVAIIEKTFKIK
jgi:large subunit ribosomal protein L4